MSEPDGAGTIPAADRRTLWSLLLVAGAVAAAMLSAGAEARSATAPGNSAPPTITGIAVTGETLTASAGSWTGTQPITFTFSWERCDAALSCAPTGTTTSTYLVVGGDVGFTLRVVETATNVDGTLSVPSAPTAVVTPQTAPVNTAEPLISGSPVEGSTLSTTNGTWSGTGITFTHQWVRCDAGGGLPDGSDCPSIPGATSSSYSLTASDIGRRLRVQVTATNAIGAATIASNPTDVVTQSTTTGPPRNTAEPSISGTPAVGRALSASVGTWAGETLTFTYRWVRCDADGGLPDGSNCTTITGATTSSYIPSSDDVGRPLRVQITASNSLGTQTVASNATAAIQASSTLAATAPRNTLVPSISGTPTQGQSLFASLGSWTGTTPLTYTYRWLRCDADGGEATGSDCSVIAAATSATYVLVLGDVGRRLRVQVTARNTSGTATATSGPTALVQVVGSTPPPPPSPSQEGPLPPGAVRLPNGKYSIPITSVSLPARLIVDQIVFRPNPVRSRRAPLVLRVHVVDTRGYVVRDALVFARATPLLTSSSGEQRSGRDGWVSLRMTLRADFPLRNGHSVQFFVRARKPAENLLAGVSTRRLVQVATAAPS